MKLLLDENLPHQLRLELPGHDVFTVAFMGWSGVENGELLKQAADNGFEALITNDRGLEYQQNLESLPGLGGRRASSGEHDRSHSATHSRAARGTHDIITTHIC